MNSRFAALVLALAPTVAEAKNMEMEDMVRHEEICADMIEHVSLYTLEKGGHLNNIPLGEIRATRYAEHLLLHSLKNGEFNPSQVLQRQYYDEAWRIDFPDKAMTWRPEQILLEKDWEKSMSYDPKRRVIEILRYHGGKWRKITGKTLTHAHRTQDENGRYMQRFRGVEIE